MRWSSHDIARFVARGDRAQSAVNDILVANRSAKAAAPRMNKLETSFAQLLELERCAGRWVWWGFESMTLRLAAGARYTPDFPCIDAGGHLVIHEVKGHWREAALVRIKVAAELYPFFRFVAVTRPKGGTWTYKQFP
jgi:hypothetical protein